MANSKSDLGYNKYPIWKHSKPQPQPFRFKPTGTQKAVGPTVHGQPRDVPQAIPEARVIDGKVVQSKEEWFVYQALMYLGTPRWAIHYQVQYRGGRSLGGQVLDFLITMGGAQVVLRIMGTYWHPGEYGSAKDVFGFGQLISDGYVVKDIKANDIRDLHSAVQALKRTNLF